VVRVPVTGWRLCTCATVRRRSGWPTCLPGDRELAEDLAQEAFVRVARRLSGLRDADSFHWYLAPIKVGRYPDSIVFTPDGKTAYIANSMGDTVTAIRTATNTVVKTIKTGIHPVAVAITPDGKTVYVANSGSDTVTPIRVATNTALKPIKTGRSPDAIVITP
jgi:YVTN family beta-propeller protein